MTIRSNTNNYFINIAMADDTTQNRNRTRAIISLVASILIGITFIAAGTGKAIGFGEIPGQTVEFIGDVLPEAFLNPTTVFLIYEIFIPYILPGTELLFGIFLLIGFVPRLIAVLCIPLTVGLMVNNIWSISQGLDKFPECVCFGVWEKIFGGLTPVQALSYDIVLFALALVIIFVYPGRFLSSREWLTRLLKKAASDNSK
jgi:uncharacterized membrane protein YphA (DoxX/SURF4 family)